MRKTSLAIISASIALSLSVAACGGDDPTVTSTPQTPAVTTPQDLPTETTKADDERPAKTSSSQSDSGTAKKKPSNSAKKGETIAQIIEDTPELATYRNALKATNGLKPLEGDGPFTIFAPNNDAFTQLGSQLDTLLQPTAKAQLADILNYHVVSGRIKGSDLTNGKLLTTQQGNRLRVQLVDGQLGLKKPDKTRATVVTADVKASNGVIHIIDSVMIPRKG